ncbi:MAG: hypothetical protein CVT66_06180 [Actinobacteria bacterium HGW-Actinobacteria-6]|nr:MAG: hypothetical protein CVT66_06180 [Actinobacteria bacterium HGW-Actinobacteria-6]
MIDKRAFLRPRTIPVSEVNQRPYEKPHLIEIGGHLAPVTMTGSGKPDKRRISGEAHVEFILFATPSALVDVFEFDASAYQVEVAAEQMAKADGSTKPWADLQDEDRRRWRTLVERLVRSGGITLPKVDTSGLNRGPVVDPEKGGK